MPKMMAPNETIWFVPKSAVPDYTVLTASIVNTSGINISCAIATGYTMNPTDSDTDDSSTICDETNSTTYVFGNYEVSLDAFLEDNHADNASVFKVVWTLFKSGPVEGYFVRRVGHKSSAAAVAGQRVDIYGGETDYAQINDANNTPKMFTIPLIPNGEFNTEQPLL